ncbi:hypothetical protein [Rhodopila sp.]|jgi:hypothetical protein|uniref:hypothetical protein n=1 Tax=Rhodopila sp. TaxID=2480087 RepID=UPI002C1F9202|nr:hypothetical protein [Rhodopila sp.]HVZ09991.1 hypothetical protein [Rhodopila sp.]
MIFIPRWLTNIVFLVAFYLCLIEHVRFRFVKKPLNTQLFLAIFCAAMVLVVTFNNHRDPWLSIAFLIVALGCLAYTWRQWRYLPPKRRYD